MKIEKRHIVESLQAAKENMNYLERLKASGGFNENVTKDNIDIWLKGQINEIEQLENLLKETKKSIYEIVTSNQG